MNYLLHPSAESDIRESAYHYRKRVNLALAQAFLSEFKNSVCLLLENPLLGSVWFHGKRRLVMKRFPYSIIYTVTDQAICILAVAHHSRRPNYWLTRKW